MQTGSRSTDRGDDGTATAPGVRLPASGCCRFRCAWASALLLALATATAPASIPAAERVGEFQLKAAFLFHLTHFVEWPAASFASPEQPFRICLVGGDPFGPALRTLETKHYQQRPIRIEILDAGGDVRLCQIAYFSGPVPTHLQAVAAGRSGLPILTVGSDERFAADGGVLRFLSERERLRMEINAASARGAQLRISAKLFEVAARVIDGVDEGTRS